MFGDMCPYIFLRKLYSIVCLIQRIICVIFDFIRFGTNVRVISQDLMIPKTDFLKSWKASPFFKVDRSGYNFFIEAYVTLYYAVSFQATGLSRKQFKTVINQMLYTGIPFIHLLSLTDFHSLSLMDCHRGPSTYTPRLKLSRLYTES